MNLDKLKKTKLVEFNDDTHICVKVFDSAKVIEAVFLTLMGLGTIISLVAVPVYAIIQLIF